MPSAVARCPTLEISASSLPGSFATPVNRRAGTTNMDPLPPATTGAAPPTLTRTYGTLIDRATSRGPNRTYCSP